MKRRGIHRRLPVGGFLAGTGISILGNVIAVIAIPWFVLENTGSASQTGFTGVAAALPVAISGMLGGPLVDRLGGRRMSILSDLVSAAAIMAIPILYRLELLTFPLLLALVFLGAILDIPGVTGRRMLLPAFQKQAGLRPEQMNTAFETLSNVGNLVGPAIAGVLLVTTGPLNLLWVTAAGFLISAAGVAFLAPKTGGVTISAERPSYFESIREGLGFIVRTRLLLAMAVLFGLTNFLSNGFFSVGLPVLVYETWGTATRLGLLFSTLGVGTLAGALLYGAVGHRFRNRRRLVMVLAFSTQPLWFSTFIWSDQLPVLALAIFLMGFVAGPVNPMSVTVRFEHIPQALHGRVFATFSAITATITPLGVALSGLIMERWSVYTGISVIVVAYAMVAIALPFVGVFSRMDSPGPFVEEPR